MSFLTDSGVVLDKKCCRFGQEVMSLWTRSVVVLDKKCCRFGQEVLSFWTRSVVVLNKKGCLVGKSGGALKSDVTWEMNGRGFYKQLRDFIDMVWFFHRNWHCFE